MSSWYLPFRSYHYDVKAAFEKQGFILWNQQAQKRIKTGDTVYLYGGDPIRRILFKGLVIEDSVIYKNDLDKDSEFVLDGEQSTSQGDECFKIIPIEENVEGGWGSDTDLREIGWTCFEWRNKFSTVKQYGTSQAETVEKNFHGRSLREYLTVGETVSSADFGSGVVKSLSKTEVCIAFPCGEKRFKYPKSVLLGKISKN